MTGSEFINDALTKFWAFLVLSGGTVAAFTRMGSTIKAHSETLAEHKERFEESERARDVLRNDMKSQVCESIKSLENRLNQTRMEDKANNASQNTVITHQIETLNGNVMELIRATERLEGRLQGRHND